MNFIKKIKEFISKVEDAFTIGDIPPTVVAVGVSAVIGAVMLLVLSGMQSSSSVTVNSATYNALGNGITGLGNIFAQYPLLGTVVGLVLILGVVLYFFYRGNVHDGSGL